MPGWLYQEWLIYMQFEPLNTARRLERMLAQLMALLINMRRRKGAQPVEAKKFLPDYKPPKRKKPVESKKLFGMFRDWAILAGAEDPKQKD